MSSIVTIVSEYHFSTFASHTARPNSKANQAFIWTYGVSIDIDRHSGWFYLYHVSTWNTTVMPLEYSFIYMYSSVKHWRKFKFSLS